MPCDSLEEKKKGPLGEAGDPKSRWGKNRRILVNPFVKQVKSYPKKPAKSGIVWASEQIMMIMN